MRCNLKRFVSEEDCNSPRIIGISSEQLHSIAQSGSMISCCFFLNSFFPNEDARPLHISNISWAIRRGCNGAL